MAQAQEPKPGSLAQVMSRYSGFAKAPRSYKPKPPAAANVGQVLSRMPRFNPRQV